MVIKSIVFTADGELSPFPPEIIPRVLDEQVPIYDALLDKSPKSVAFPADEIVIKSIPFDRTVLGEFLHPPGKIPRAPALLFPRFGELVEIIIHF